MKHLTTEQRYQLEAYLKLNQSKAFIAQELNVDRSTIYREIARNKLKNGAYSARKANEYYKDRKDRFSSNGKFTNECQKLVLKYLNK